MINYPTFSLPADEFSASQPTCDLISTENFITNSSKIPNFSLLQMNIRSCKKNFSQLQLLLSSLLFKFTIIILTETWLSKSTDLLCELDGYKSVATYRDNHGGGIKLFIRDFLSVSVIDEMSFIGDLFESLTCEVFTSSSKYIISCIYRPPHTSISQFNKSFQENILSKLTVTRSTIICGDFNINLFNPLALQSINNFISLLLTFNFYSVINLPTKYNPTNQITKFSLIDQIWINFSPFDLSSSVITTDISDHYSVCMHFKSVLKIQPIVSKFRIFSEENIAKFKNFFSCIDFTEMLLQENGDRMFSTFYKTIFDAYDRHFPVKSKKHKNNFNSQWMTPELKYCVKKKYKLLKMLKRNEIPKDSYITYRNMLNDTVRQAKVIFYMRKSISTNNDAKKTWKFVNEMLNKNKKEKICAIDDNEGRSLAGHDMVNYFNCYFVNVVSTIVSNGPSRPLQTFFKNIPLINDSFYFFPVTAFEVQSVVVKLKDKPCCITDISTKVIKSVSLPISYILSYLFNHLIESGIYPTVLKKARVIPIYKSGNKQDVGNYRPISTLLTLNKIFEKIIYGRMNSFIILNGLISKYQYGFKKNSSTTLAIFNLVTHIVESLKTQKYAVCIFLDLRKAFDSVNHKILLNKLFRMGFRGNIHSLISSYLTNRSQYVELDGYKSTDSVISHGVPQGSILGPLLFNLFFNDVTCLKCDGRSLFADDGVFWLVDCSFERLIFRLNYFMDELLNWLNENKLLPNSNKTFLMLFANRTIHNLPDIYLGNDLLQWVDNIKYLGVIIDNKLNFNMQLNSINAKISKCTGIIYRLKTFLPKSILLNLYYSLFYPYLIHNIIIWGGVSSNKIEPIQIKMNKTLRYILNVHFYPNHRPMIPTTDMYKELKLLKFKDIFEYFMVKFIHSCVYGVNYNIFEENFLSLLPNHSYEMRDIKINYPIIRLQLEKFMPRYHFIRLFNELPKELLTPQSALRLKNNYKKHVLENY